MSKKEFKLPPLAPLIGSGIPNYMKVTAGKKIESKYWIKYILTGAIITILSPFRWYDRWHFRKIDKLKVEKPIFILGHWRSGTTHLHNIMCQAPAAGYVTTYQSVFSNYLSSQTILKPVMGMLMPEKRPSDNVKLNVAYPQEEEFALSNMSVSSYYHFFYFPKLFREYFNRDIAFNASKGHVESFKKSYQRLLQLATVNMAGSEYLVVKNPVNTGRFEMLSKMYPDAKFIHIYRNPYIVFLSTKKFFMELMPTLWFHRVSEGEIEQMVLENYVRIHDLLYSTGSLYDKVYDVKFEEFEEDPLRFISDIYRELEIEGFEDSKPYFEEYVAGKKSYRKNKYSISRREYELVSTHWRKYIERWNYELPYNLEIVD